MATGGGELAQVTRGGGAHGLESWDGRLLYYSRSDEGSGIWRVAVDGGEEVEVLAGPIDYGSWDLVQDGLYFSKWEMSGDRRAYTIQFLDFESAR